MIPSGATTQERELAGIESCWRGVSSTARLVEHARKGVDEGEGAQLYWPGEEGIIVVTKRERDRNDRKGLTDRNQ